MREFSEAERRELVRLFEPAAAREVGPREADQFLDALGPPSADERPYSAQWRVASLQRWCRIAAPTMLSLQAIPAEKLAAEHLATVKVADLAGQLYELLSKFDNPGGATDLFAPPGARTRDLSEAQWRDLCNPALNRLHAFRRDLASLREAARAAEAASRPRRGPPIKVGRVVFMENLCRTLMMLGLPFQTGERTPMVRACAIACDALGLPGDPRDTLRRMDRMFATGSRLNAQLIAPPTPAKARARRGANST